MILISALILSNIAGGRADHLDNMYRDQIRPHGHVRSDAIYDANLDACYDQTGADRNVADAATFKKCMLMHGWRWQYARLIRDAAPAKTMILRQRKPRRAMTPSRVTRMP
jgi:hypothetical protein